MQVQAAFPEKYDLVSVRHFDNTVRTFKQAMNFNMRLNRRRQASRLEVPTRL